MAVHEQFEWQIVASRTGGEESVQICLKEPCLEAFTQQLAYHDVGQQYGAGLSRPSLRNGDELRVGVE